MDHSHVNGDTLRKRASQPAPPKPVRTETDISDEPGGALAKLGLTAYALAVVSLLIIVFISETTGAGVTLVVGLVVGGSICGLASFCQRALWKLEQIRLSVVVRGET